MTKKNAPQPQQSSCPYRGSQSDPEVRFGFPASNTYCYKAAPPAPIDTGHQSIYCLTGEHVNCPVFQQRKAAPLPAEVAAALPKKRRSSKSTTPQARRMPFLWIVLPLLMIVGGGIAWTQIGGQSTVEPTIPLIAVVTETPTVTPTNVPATRAATITPLPTDTSSPTSEATVTATATNTPAPTNTATPTETIIPTSAPTSLPTATPTPVTIDTAVRLGRVLVRRGPESGYRVVSSTGEAGEVVTAIGRTEDSLWIEICCVEGESGWIPAGFVNLSGVLQLPVNTPPKTVAIISEPMLDLLEYPNYSAESLGILAQGEEFEIAGRFGNDWIKLCCIGGRTGWVYVGTLFIDGDSSEIPLIESAIPTPTPTPNASTTSSSMDGVVRVGGVIVRRGPEPGYRMIATTGDAGATVTAIGRSADSLWLEVCCFDGESGWIPSGFVRLPEILQLPVSTAPETLAIISEPVLDLLESPNYSAGTVAVIMQGDEFDVIGRSGSDWVKLCCVDDQEGWVFIGTLFIDGNIDAIAEE